MYVSICFEFDKKKKNLFEFDKFCLCEKEKEKRSDEQYY